MIRYTYYDETKEYILTFHKGYIGITYVGDGIYIFPGYNCLKTNIGIYPTAGICILITQPMIPMILKSIYEYRIITNIFVEKSILELDVFNSSNDPIKIDKGTKIASLVPLTMPYFGQIEPYYVKQKDVWDKLT